MEGHRDELRKKFLKYGILGFYDYEILELLMTYVVVRKNCEQLSKNMLKKYGDLYTILNLPIKELTKNKYITERAAIFFKLIHSIFEKELYQKAYKEKISISCNDELLKYLKFSLLKRDVEVFRVIFLNSQNELIKEEDLFFGTLDRSNIYIRELIKKILNYNAKSIIIVHNHPSGSLEPSGSDIMVTRKLKDVLESIEIRLLDHLIVSEKGHFSFLGNELL